MSLTDGGDDCLYGEMHSPKVGSAWLILGSGVSITLIFPVLWEMLHVWVEEGWLRQVRVSTV